MHKLFIISGPGGVGKDAIMAELIKDNSLNISRLVNCTSRNMRAGEIDGEKYRFLTRDEFEKEINHGHMLEYEVMESNNHYYGTHKQTLLDALEKSNVISDKLVKGALELKGCLKEQAVLIFIDADDEELERRLLESNRHLEHANANRRLEQGREERLHKQEYDYNFENHDGKLSETTENIRKTIKNIINP